jgi:hypothetical protein
MFCVEGQNHEATWEWWNRFLWKKILYQCHDYGAHQW